MSSPSRHQRTTGHPSHHGSAAHQHHRRQSEDSLVLDVHELERRPGSMRTYHVDAVAPADLGTVVLAVPLASPVTVDLRLESVEEGIVATGTARARVTGECVRCLDPISDDVEVEFQELYVYPESDATDDEARRLDGDDLDLEPAVRDALVLDLPFQPTCRPDCPGLCPECGARLADDPGHDHGPPTDPRWAALADLAAARGHDGEQ